MRGIFFSISTLCFVHCATIQNTFSDSNSHKADKIYIGLRVDLEDIDRGLSSKGGHAGLGYFGAIFGIVDLPFSAALDTVFLPYTIPNYYANRERLYNRSEILEIYANRVKGRQGQEGRLYYVGSAQFRHFFRIRSGHYWEELVSDTRELRLPQGVEFTHTDPSQTMVALDPENAFRPIPD